ncbi:DUF3842 family protein [Alkalibacter rhizosphaerae]|uniref:DUF3842 family protein n=1 Tax=Alkalibacter rhizosphaerae TaxID=2815577 RepID=A0A974XFT2_9FIRM|nr:DUF3842 family protein [Alkalibacter rhizosphaerae]QSX07935.1 DUF3842 family protein [Alkalibacter rhizosphaerae]
MKIAVIDGQGGGIGRVVIEKLRAEFEQKVHIIGLGTNALATAAMLKAGANEGGTGENAIMVNAAKADVIVGSIAILVPDALTGELTTNMASAIARSDAKKVFVPMNKCDIYIAGVANEPLPHYIDYCIKIIKDF